MRKYIQKILDQFQKCKLVVVGDVMLDHYALGKVSRISPEAPIQVLDIEKEKFCLGGASNVACNLKALGCEVEIVGVVGQDSNGDIVCSLIQELGISDQGIFRDPSRPTTVKTRLMAQGSHLLRTDREVRSPIDNHISQKIIQFVKNLFPEYDGIIFSDYAKGVLIEPLCQSLIQIAKENGKGVFIGPKGRKWDHYKGATLLSANRLETEQVSGISLKSLSKVKEVATSLCSKLDLEAMVVTLGSQGLSLTSQKEGTFYMRAEAKEVFDVAGAGDTVLAILSLAYSTECSWKTAARLANAGAGIVVGKVGTATLSPQELARKLSQKHISYLDKLKSLDELVLQLQQERNQGKIIVFTNGCFDLLHTGHVRYLEYCKSRGDILVVAVNDDKSVQKLKGESRPVIHEQDRAELLAALSCVDYVVIFSQLTPAYLIEKIRPDVLIKGMDWAEKGVVGKEFVESYGGKVELYELETGYSTSKIIEKIKEI